MDKMQLEAIKTNIITPEDRINSVVSKALHGREDLESTVIVIASKIISITQKRTVKISSEAEYNQLIEKESDILLGGNPVQLSLKDNIFTPWAGIDRSNIEKGNAVLWPLEAFKAADAIKKHLQGEHALKNIGIIIADSFCAPLRAGVISVAIGYSGFKGVKDMKGKKDLHGNKMSHSRHAMADGLATAATLLMGETAEQTPIVIIKGAPVQFTNDIVDPKEAIMEPKDCLYAPIYPDSINKN